MNIVVCVKRVPDTAARIKIQPDGGVDQAGLKYVVSPYDEYALEAALRLKEAAGEGTVTALSVGDAASAEQLRSALAMGADDAVLLKADVGMDGLTTARAIASEIAERAPDLVLFGVKAVDGDQQQVGLMAAELAGLPAASVAATVDVEDGAAVCHREVEGAVEVLEVPLPAAVTVTKGEKDPRYPSLKGIMAAKRKPLVEKDAAPGEARLAVRSLAEPPARPEGRVVGEGADAVPELVRLLREEAKVL
ncbi:MAG: electron transfer flavoprotein subunit beta/FixA family protein [Gemmatimonadota bacterium]